MEKINGGYYLKAKCVQESWISKAPPHIREIWDLFIRKAFYQDGESLKRGQLIITYSEIIEELAWFIGYRKMTYKKHHCEIAMKALVKETMITTTKTTRGVIVTILNYDKYQDIKNYECYTKNIVNTTGTLQPTDTIEKEIKEVKERKKENKKDICTDEQKALADELIKVVSLRREIHVTEKQRSSWVNTIRLMVERDKLQIEKIYSVLSWYEKNWMNQYVPVIESACSFREKWTKILNAIDRDKKTATKDNNNGFDQRDYAKDATPDSKIPDFLR